MRYACLLRGINVSGQRKIGMAELCRHAETLGFKDVSAYLLTGNLVLDSDLPAQTVARHLSRGIADAFQYPDVDVAVVDRRRLERMLASAPPEMAAGTDWYLTFLMASPDDALTNTLEGSEHQPDTYTIGDGVVYVHCPNGYGRTKINNAFFERRLKVRATTRNLNTVHALRERLQTVR